MVLENFLFVIPLRSGNIYMGIIGAVFYLVTFIRLITKTRYGDSLISLEYVSFIQFIVCVIFIVGILKRKKYLLLPWLVAQILLILVVAVYLILPLSPLSVSLTINWIVFHGYLWACGFTQYKRTTTGGGGEEGEYLIEQSLENDKFSGRPTVLENVLFFIPLRIGNVIMGILGTIFYLVLTIYLIQNRSMNYTEEFFNISVTSLTLIHTIMCAIFVVGLLKMNQGMLLPWLLSQIPITIETVALYLTKHRYDILEVTPLVFNWILFQTYLWLCGYSVYQCTPKKEANCNSTTSTEEKTFSEMLKHNLCHKLNPTVLENVFFCIHLRIGNIFLGLAGALFSLVGGVYFIITFTSFTLNHYWLSASEPIYVFAMISASLAHFIVCVFFVVGILKNQQHMLFPWLFSQIVITVFVTLYSAEYWTPDVIALFINWTVFQAYIWFCGYSMYLRIPTRGTVYKVIPSTEI